MKAVVTQRVSTRNEWPQHSPGRFTRRIPYRVSSRRWKAVGATVPGPDALYQHRWDPMSAVAATSAVPYMVLAGSLLLILSLWQVRSLLRSIRRTDPKLSVPQIKYALIERCGFRLRSPSVLAVSFPLATLAISSDLLVLTGPLGAYSFRREQEPLVTRGRPTTFARFARIQIATPDMRATVYLRQPEAVLEALESHTWIPTP